MAPEMPSPAARPLPPWARKAALFVGVFVSGASVMIVEVLGSRVLGPFFGIGLFVWSALLTVTLTALAAGYYLGGALADRAGSLRLPPRLIVAAGCLVALIPLCSDAVLTFSDGFGIRLGALLSAFLLFGPCLVVMGMVTTAATRQAMLEVARPGRAAGIVYSVSTLGGLSGTLLTGFVLVPRWELATTWAVTAGALILAGSIGSYIETRSPLSGAALLLLLPALAAPDRRLGEHIRVLERSESLRGKLSVIQDDSRNVPLRLLRVDHSFVGGQWETGDPAFAFVHLLEGVRLARPEGRELLQIGLGIGSLSMAMAKVGIRTDAVEIDPEVIRLAEKYFGYVPTGKVYAEDARVTIRELRRRYDFIVHDTFTGGNVPEHLLSVDVLQRLQELLQPGGVLALNLVGAENGPLSRATRAVDRTLRHVFQHVRVFRDGPLDEKAHTISNLIFFASALPIVFAQPAEFESPACERILRNFEHWEVVRAVDPLSPLVTDAKNPLARLSFPVAEAFRTAMNELYPVEFWLR